MTELEESNFAIRRIANPCKEVFWSNRTIETSFGLRKTHSPLGGAPLNIYVLDLQMDRDQWMKEHRVRHVGAVAVEIALADHSSDFVLGFRK